MTQIKSDTEPIEKKRFGLSEQVMIALVFGVATGIFLGEMAGPLETIGIVFIRMLQITIIPYISASLITGIGGLRIDEVKRLTIKAGGITLFFWAMTLLVLICLPMAYPSWPSASFYSASLVEGADSIDFLNLFIPSNPILAYANSSVPAVVVFSVLVGLSLINLTGKSTVIDPLSIFQNVMMKITGFVTKLSPIGVFALVASTTGKADLADLARIQVYIVLYIMISLSFALVILPGLVASVTPFKYKNILKALRAPMITAFATGSSLIVVPLLIEQCKKLIVDAGLSSMMEEDSDTTLEVIIPTVYSFPSMAGILALSFITFSGWYIGSEVPATSYPILLSAGVPSLFGGTTITIPFLLNLMGIPVDFFNIFVSVDVITVRFGTFLSAMQYAAVGLIATISIFKKLRIRWGKMIKLACLSCMMLGAIVIGTNAFYTHIIVAPYTKDKALKAIDLLAPPQPHKVFSHIPPERIDNPVPPASPSQIEDRGVLRVCFQPNEYPSSFYSFGDTSKLIGFDIEMAHQFARQMGIPIEFLPAQTEAQASILLNKGVCDLYMRTTPITYNSNRVFNMSDAVYQSSLGLVVKDAEQQKFKDWNQIKRLGKSFRVAVEMTPVSMRAVNDIFPGAAILPITSLDELKQIFESGAKEIDAIADMAEEGAAWTLLYPDFSLVVPKPAVFFHVGYAAAKGNHDLTRALNAWLLSIKASGGVDRLYNHWMLGEGMIANKQPRWSIIRNVLGWVE